MPEYEEGFWLLIDDEWIQVDKAKYVAAERAAGFNGPHNVPATAAFLGLDGSCGSTLRPKEIRDQLENIKNKVSGT